MNAAEVDAATKQGSLGRAGYRRSAGSARGEARRRELLDRVTDDLAVNGLVDFSLRRAARAAGTTHKVLLYHFDGVDDLLGQAMLALRERRIGNALAAAGKGRGRKTLAARVRALWPILMDEPSGLRDRTHRANPGGQRLASASLAGGGQRIADSPLAQREHRLPEQVVDPVEVVEQHLVRSAGRPRSTTEREVHEAVDREIVGDPVEQLAPPGLAARRSCRSPVACLLLRPSGPAGIHIDSIHAQTSSPSDRIVGPAGTDQQGRARFLHGYDPATSTVT